MHTDERNLSPVTLTRSVNKSPQKKLSEKNSLVKTQSTCMYNTVAQKCHGNFNLLTQFQFAHGSFNLHTAVSICSRQFPFGSRQFQFRPRQFQFAHGSFNLLTAVSICSQQFQFRSRQFQFAHGNFNLPTAVSICSRPFQFRS